MTCEVRNKEIKSVCRTFGTPLVYCIMHGYEHYWNLLYILYRL